jgi:di/tripeptidase
VVSRPSRRQERRFELQQDAGRNLVIRVPASLNREAAPTRVLEGHVDIACKRDDLFFGGHAPARPVPTTTTP